ncbi:ribose-phosphate pyrophosphokinase [Sphingomonas changnyeongensis]|uniref:ribose-phosphate pyrophosphokinase n=1 Tax=Sphingomonas changnyeongensis TaxID=2698679 RepID=UPI001E4A9128|nr:ribose-phosphate pyrophosphokinase [Sphingomonas changnyeongensis]
MTDRRTAQDGQLPGVADPVRVRALLVAAARARSAVSYAGLLGQLGHRFTRPLMRSLCRTLDAIDAEAAGRGEPELAVLVVRESDGLPGQGWWAGGRALMMGHDGPWTGPAARALVARLQAEAFDYWAAHLES